MVAGSDSTSSTIRVIVRIDSTGYLPTLVSPESITASGSVEYRVGDIGGLGPGGPGLVIIESSIWVATMTGLAFSRHSWTALFCTTGTRSSGSSAPRSLRATMIPSKAAATASRLATASGSSSFVITASQTPRPLHNLSDED
jgi:hypothetical protein